MLSIILEFIKDKIENIKTYFKYLKFYIKNKNKIIKFDLSNDFSQIEGTLKVHLIPSIYIFNKDLNFGKLFKMTDFKKFNDFFDIYNRNS